MYSICVRRRHRFRHLLVVPNRSIRVPPILTPPDLYLRNPGVKGENQSRTSIPENDIDSFAHFDLYLVELEAEVDDHSDWWLTLVKPREGLLAPPGLARSDSF